MVVPVGSVGMLAGAAIARFSTSSSESPPARGGMDSSVSSPSVVSATAGRLYAGLPRGERRCAPACGLGTGAVAQLCQGVSEGVERIGELGMLGAEDPLLDRE